MQTPTETADTLAARPAGLSAPISPALAETRCDTLEFVRAMLGQLHHMAADQRCMMLAYLIEMAAVEASDIIATDRRRQAGSRSVEGESET